MQPKQQTQLGLEVERRVAGGKVDRYRIVVVDRCKMGREGCNFSGTSGERHAIKSPNLWFARHCRSRFRPSDPMPVRLSVLVH